jgi:hypothetical protein
MGSSRPQFGWNSRQYVAQDATGCSVKGKTIVQSFGDGLFIYRKDLTGFHKASTNQRDFDSPKPNRLVTR